jgi:hypothetical protein
LRWVQVNQRGKEEREMPSDRALAEKLVPRGPRRSEFALDSPEPIANPIDLQRRVVWQVPMTG